MTVDTWQRHVSDASSDDSWSLVGDEHAEDLVHDSSSEEEIESDASLLSDYSSSEEDDCVEEWVEDEVPPTLHSPRRDAEKPRRSLMYHLIAMTVVSLIVYGQTVLINWCVSRPAMLMNRRMMFAEPSLQRWAERSEGIERQKVSTRKSPLCWQTGNSTVEMSAIRERDATFEGPIPPAEVCDPKELKVGGVEFGRRPRRDRSPISKSPTAWYPKRRVMTPRDFPCVEKNELAPCQENREKSWPGLIYWNKTADRVVIDSKLASRLMREMSKSVQRQCDSRHQMIYRKIRNSIEYKQQLPCMAPKNKPTIYKKIGKPLEDWSFRRGEARANLRKIREI